ncbi:hypothetical protein [Bradyrhizobium sp. HKCCYLRH3061]|uniref:hypothetical protein n=1 Tax=Bradyrhizobium sp. HKCCYLRH3061 TaxID=3420734 RepID=UPI003EB89AA3
MIYVGQREFIIPTRLWAALPLAAVGYVAVDLAWQWWPSPTALEHVDWFLDAMARFASAYLAAFLVVDIASRSRTPWYGLFLLIPLAHLVAAFVIAVLIVQPLSWLPTAILRGAFAVAVAPRGPAGREFLALVFGTLAVIPLLAALAALFVTLATLIVSRLPLLTPDARRELWPNLTAAILWLPVSMAVAIALRVYGYVVPRPAALLAALVLALASICLHLRLVHRVRREQPHGGRLRTWLAAAVCCSALVLLAPYPIQYFSLLTVMPGYIRPVMPNLFGLYMDHVRPAFRAIGMLPTPVIEVAGYRVDVPFNDRTTMMEPTEATDGYDFVRITLPVDFGVTTVKHVPSVAILRAAAIRPSDLFWSERHRDLEQAARAAQPGQEVVVRSESGFGRDVGLRSDAYPELEFWLRSVDPATSWEEAEQALRRFLQQRLRRAN